MLPGRLSPEPLTWLAGPAGGGQQLLAALAGHDPPEVAIPGESYRGQVERRQRAPGREGAEDGFKRLGVSPGAGQLARAVHRGGEARSVAEAGDQPAIVLALVGQGPEQVSDGSPGAVDGPVKGPPQPASDVMTVLDHAVIQAGSAPVGES